MKDTYRIIREYLFNGVFGYALFGLYALTVAPIVTQFIDFGVQDGFIALFGFGMLIAEFFALQFKIRMIRMRAGGKRDIFKKRTGRHILPTASSAVFFQFFLRLVFRVGVVMVCMTALGYPSTEKLMTPQGVIAIMTVFVLDMTGFLYIYLKSDVYTEPPRYKKEFAEEIKLDAEWEKKHAELLSAPKYFRWEVICDIVLNAYALMLYTVFWEYINKYSMFQMREIGGGVFIMMFFIVMFSLMPMRIAYWIEDSMNAFTGREKFGMWLVFGIVAVFTCSPTIMQYMHWNATGESWEVKPLSEGTYYTLSACFFLVMLIVQLVLFKWGKYAERKELPVEEASNK